jgi:hypothetical protein
MTDAQGANDEESAQQLATLMQQAQADPTAFPMFLRALLEATVYVHAPSSDDHPRLRLLQFERPDGITVLPFFSEWTQAYAAAGQGVRVLRFIGREFMEFTRGATLMLNPNDVSCTLFPEEVSALLDRDAVADLERGEVAKGNEPQVSISSDDLAWLTNRVASVLTGLPDARAAYLLDARFPQSPDHLVRLIAISVSRAHSERAARAVIVAIQKECERRRCSVDLTTFDPGSTPPAWIEGLAVDPFYQRSPS